MKKKEEAEKSWQGEKIAEFAKEQREKGEEVEDFEMKEAEGSSDDDDERWYEEEESKVTLPQGVAGRGAVGGQQSSVRLVELGPRMRLQLVKIEEGLLEGEVLHHSFLEKTEEEKKEIKERMAKRKKEKEQRKRQQALNVKKKEKEREANKNKSLEGMKKKEEAEKSWQ